MPYSIRPRISSTSRHPSGVSAASSGERPPSAGLGDRNHRKAFRRFAKTSPARAVMDKRASGMAGVRCEEVSITPRIHLYRLQRQPVNLAETLSGTKAAGCDKLRFDEVLLRIRRAEILEHIPASGLVSPFSHCSPFLVVCSTSNSRCLIIITPTA